ncbi:MAG TPA: glycoside hydrolase family 2 TIM barrel-domain containing protein [Steroidobacteraceae bacterium]|nr:glycoside hydrolase family 2 TIM barrel-domain containing protein [Steroidobacteraceae bacterium]
MISTTPGDPLHPRPQLQRERWISLDGPWRFAFDPERRWHRPSDVDEWPLTIRVPFAPESKLSGIGDTGFHPVCWYEREFDLPELPPKGRLLLHFGAVDYQARVWVNGLRVFEHEGGHVPFVIDITRALKPGGPQRVTVQAIDDPQDLEKPRGKQDWKLEPHGIWYPRTSGIWQTVWLEPVSDPYIRAIKWTPNLERWEVTFHGYVEGERADETEVRLRLCAGSKVLIDDDYRVLHGEVHRKLGLSDPGIDDFRNEILWSPERPTLLHAEIELVCGSEVIDRAVSYTALRSFGVQRDRLMLNGRHYQLRLVLDQGYWPDSLMTAPDPDALRRDVELAKAMGFNGVRKHQKIEDPRYLYWADVLGLLVWEEMPSAYRFTPRTVQRLVREWTAVVQRDRSHPCVIVWVPFNESWGVPDLATVPASRHFVATLYHLTKTLDPDRPVIGNDGWESSTTDIIGIHDYDDPQHLRVRYGPEVQPQELVDRRWTAGRILTLDGHPHRGQPICLTEFGGVAYANPHDPAHENEWGYVRCDTIEEFTERCLSLIEVARTTGMFSGFCYTQFADTFQEANGLLTARREPKIPIERIAQAVRGNVPVSLGFIG